MDCEVDEAELMSPGLPALTNSERGCKHNQFLCPGLNITKFLHRSSVCDGINDCGNNEDEINCNNRCEEENQFYILKEFGEMYSHGICMRRRGRLF